MAEQDAQALPASIRLAGLLNLGLNADQPSDAFQALVPKADADWIDLFALAQRNRALAPLAYIFAQKPAFAALLETEELEALREWNGLLQTRAGLITAQVTEFADLFHKNGQDLLLLKGASRLFDGLYPDPACRYFVDVDPLVKNADLYYKAFDLGYGVLDDAAFDLKSVRAGNIDVAIQPIFHHLPPLCRDGDQVVIELHLHPFARKFDHLAIPDLWQDSTPVDGIPGLRIPSNRHQIIINVIHTVLHGLAKERVDLSIRDLFEGHLLYQRASTQEREYAEKHFTDRGYGKDFALWVYVCGKMFPGEDEQLAETKFHIQFFDQLITMQENPATRYRKRLMARIKNFIFLELTHWGRLKKRFRYVTSAAFWRRMKNEIRNARLRPK